METVLAGRYSFIRPLGGGGFGQTFLATDRHLPGQPICVVKQLKPRSKAGDTLKIAKRLFDQEAATLYRLGNHDQIPRLLAHFEQAGEFYLVQDHVEGASLQEELARRGHLKEPEVVSLVRDLLEVLTFVHQQNVIHRDIKPSNIIHRQSDRRFVLIDFGAVKQVTAHTGAVGQTSLTVVVGSPGYIPPEQLASRPHFSSDLYALGIVALQSLSGIPAIELPRDLETGEICCAALGDRLSISPDLATFLDTLVRYDYRHRYPTAAHALADCQSLYPIAGSESLDRLVDLAPTPTVPKTLQAETLPPVAHPTLIQRLSQSPLSSDSRRPYFPATSRSDLSSQEYRNRQALLNKVKNFWVKGVLEASLQDQVLIVLGLEAQSNAISPPWNVAIAANPPLNELSPGTRISSIFDQMGTGRSLLILGEPGAGKTTTLLQLARDLIARAEQDVTHLIPVVLNLSSWIGSHQPIAHWVVEELNIKYQVPRRVGQAWVEQQQLLLLLDGLDEVRSDYREACVVAINQFQQEYSTELVVCSRSRDYEALSHRLKVQVAVCLRSLTSEQIHYYLDSLSTNLSGLKQLLQDQILLELAQSPLLLNLMVLAYQGIAVEDLPQTEVLAERRSQVFDAYIDRMFQRRGNAHPYSRPQTLHWLNWLARQMICHSQTIVLIERLQRSWLQTFRQRLFYTLISTSIISLILGLIYGIATAVSFGIQRGMAIGLLTWAASNILQAIVVWFVVEVERMPVSARQSVLQRFAYSVGAGIILGISTGMIVVIDRGVLLGIAVGWVSGVIGGVADWFTGSRFTRNALGLTETLKWSWPRIRRNLVFWLPIGITTGLAFHGLGLLNQNWIISLISGAVTGAVAGVATGLDASSEIETKTRPNQGIRQSAKNCLLIACMTTPALMLSAIVLSVPLYIAIIYGVLISLNLGGSACVVHASLRLTFWLDRRMPWNDARFLDHATQLTFLQKVGGGYIFVHRLLMEHFARKQV
ncbi:protein kinase domain-containing protein [Egbenema bharatensis]|uniref:protein kinase domain-containing protein n=1 Tax=Egbenema bharatensis TaxID=3463334 RepID=UPI003A8BAF17